MPADGNCPCYNAGMPSDLVFLKLGGSLITEKSRARTPRPEVIRRLAQEIAASPFGCSRPAARPRARFRIVRPCGGEKIRNGRRGEDGGGLGRLRRGMGRRRRVEPPGDGCPGRRRRAVPSGLRLPPMRRAGKWADWRRCRRSPYGWRWTRGWCRSSTAIRCSTGRAEAGSPPRKWFSTALTRALHPQRILLAGIERGVFADYPERKILLRRIRARSGRAPHAKVEGSEHTDVTGGMLSKVLTMLALVRQARGTRGAGVLRCGRGERAPRAAGGGCGRNPPGKIKTAGMNSGRFLLAGDRGFEPRHTDPESAVLPLDESPAEAAGLYHGFVIIRQPRIARKKQNSLMHKNCSPCDLFQIREIRGLNLFSRMRHA